MKPFLDRGDAGRQLAANLRQYAAQPNVLVLALPRGGVPVATEVAQALDLPLDILAVRKLGAPGQPELAVGAIASSGAIVINHDVRAYFTDQSEIIDDITKRERQELERREHAYRSTRPPISPKGRTIIVVDDGAATGASMRAAIQALRSMFAERIVAALPVCSEEALSVLNEEADEVLCLKTPHEFYAVGQWYENFEQTSDDEVRRLLQIT
jgi:predicted phosphoribosyltransferase